METIWRRIAELLTFLVDNFYQHTAFIVTFIYPHCLYTSQYKTTHCLKCLNSQIVCTV